MDPDRRLDFAERANASFDRRLRDHLATALREMEEFGVGDCDRAVRCRRWIASLDALLAEHPVRRVGGYPGLRLVE